MLYTDMHSLERMILPLARKPSELCLQLSVLPDVGTFIGLHDSFLIILITYGYVTFTEQTVYENSSFLHVICI